MARFHESPLFLSEWGYVLTVGTHLPSGPEILDEVLVDR
jgi:hypothetical protein